MSCVKPWSMLRRELVARCGIFDVERATMRSPEDGSEHGFVRILSADFVQVVPVTAAGEVVLIRQYRHGSQTTTLEIPGGLVDPGESPQQAATRELLEETGYRCERLASLGKVNPNPALFTNTLHAFSAEGAVKVADVCNDGTEHTVVELVPLGDVPRLLLDGAIDHALVVATLWRYLHAA